MIVADLFCGAGGTSTGLLQACEAAGVPLRLIAVNHWDIAISTHAKNHPHADHTCASLDGVAPRKLVPGGVLDLLVASPECTHHSVARGGKPINDQSRASAWRIVEWCSQITVNHVLIENVKEFRTWGPLGSNDRPLKRRRGETYQAFLNAMRALGYTVEDRVLNAADFGDPTSRERLFIQARRGKKPIVWPEPTHGPRIAPAAPVLFEKSPAPRRPYRTAREIIDWSIPGESIFRRKRPLSPNTMAQIWKGLQKFAGLPFFVGAGGPQGAGRPAAVDGPIGTLTTENHRALITPFLVKYYGGQAAQSIDEPLPTVTANYEHYGLCEPFIVEFRNNKSARSIDDPLSVVATSGAHHGLCEPFVLINRNNNVPKSLDDPLPTLCTGNHMYLVSPFVLSMEHGGRLRSVDKPLNTITTARGGAHGVCIPYLEPLDTVTAKDRFGLVMPELAEGQGYAILDIRFRMLQPHELAAAMSFPKSYHFVGNREQKVKQIGNAVPVRLARALCSGIVSNWRTKAKEVHA